LPETMRVDFGGELATDVRVFSQGQLTCLAPIHNPGAVDVTISNIDEDTGLPIGGETDTKANGYTFTVPNLTVQHDLTRLVRTFIRELKRQVIGEVALTTHTDFDDETGDFLNTVNIAKMPALILIGPDTSENRFFSTNEKRIVDLGDGTFDIRKPPYTVDLQFECVGVAELSVQKLNLTATFIEFISANKFIEMDRDPADLSKGRVRYELDFLEEGGEPNSTSRLSNSNVKAFAGNVVIRGFDIEGLAGVTNAKIIEKTHEILETVIDSEALNLSVPVGVHPVDTSGC